MSKLQAMFQSVAILLVFYPSLTTAAVNYGETCSSDNAELCNTDKNLVCYTPSTTAFTCAKGQCRCETGYTPDTGDQTACIAQLKTLYLGDTCSGTAGTSYTNGVTNGECTNGKMACTTDYTELSKALCGNTNTKRLGEACSGSDKCYLYTDTAASTSTFYCKQDYCGCSSSNQYYDGNTCTFEKTASTLLGDQCGNSDDCSLTSSHCIKGTCQCVTAETKYNGKCYKSNAFGDIAEGKTCTSNENECKLGLKCDVFCPGVSDEKLCNENTANVDLGEGGGSPARLGDVFIVLASSLLVVTRIIF